MTKNVYIHDMKSLSDMCHKLSVIERRASDLSRAAIVAGWLDGNGSAGKAFDNLMSFRATGKAQGPVGMPASYALIARTLNYGRMPGVTATGRRYGYIPPRPFMDEARRLFEREMGKSNGSLAAFLVRTDVPVTALLPRIGAMARDCIVEAIKKGVYTPNAASTIQKKGSAKPLIDTGGMVNSVKFEIR